MSKLLWGMTSERYKALVNNPEGTLTSEEMANGWHWCWDWDGMLVNSNDKEGEGASCYCNTEIDK